METEQLNQQNANSLSFKNTYLADLNTINNIHFTNREIDIIACISNGRAVKKTALLLKISPRTVAVHINNIMLKIGCNCKESIIDFTEKSDKFAAIKKHYTNLLTQNTFELKLRNVLDLTKKTSINCLIIYYKEQRIKDPFIQQLQQDLSFAGIKAYSYAWKKEQGNTSLLHTIYNKQINWIIYYMSNNFIEHLTKSNYEIQEEAYNLIKEQQNDPLSAVFLLSKDKISPKFDENKDDFIYIDLVKQKNYYFLVFEILKNLLPTDYINKTISEFNKQYTTLREYPFSQRKENEKLTNNDLKSKKHINIKKIFPRKAIIFLFSICVIFLFFNTIQYPSLLKNMRFKKNNMQIVDFENNNKNFYAPQFTPTEKEKIFLNLPLRNTKFTGRKISLKQIEEQLNKQKIGIITQTISGLGGIGKTQLATEFAYNSAERNIYKVILWITAETHNNINNSYREFANLLQIDIRGLKPIEVQQMVHRKLSKNYENFKTLFILDNALNYESIQDYIYTLNKQFPTNHPLHILITSRSQYWPENSFALEPFSSIEALTFVKKHLPNEEEKMIVSLTKTLHYFPLALGQAVAYIKKHTNISDYLQLYKNKERDFLNLFVGEKNQHQESLWKTWYITLSKLKHNAREILFTSAYLSPEDIPLDFFHNLTIKEKAEAIEELRKYSFISLTNNNKAFKIHRLLQEIIKLSVDYDLKRKNKTHKFQTTPSQTDNFWLTKAIDLVKANFDFNFLQPKKWKAWEKNLSYVQAISNNTTKSPEKLFRQGLELYIKYALSMTYIQCDEEPAIASWIKIRQLIQQHYKKQNNEYLVALINLHLSYAQNYAGNFQEARRLLNTSVLPIFHQKTLIIQQKDHNLINLTRILPFKDNAPEQVRKKCDLALALMSLGAANFSSGFMQEALVCYQKTFNLFAKIEQLDDRSQYYKIDAMWAITGLGYIHSGKFMTAEMMFNKAKKGIDSLYNDHPNQAYAYYNAAFLMYHIGEFEKSIYFLDKSSKIRLAYLAPQHTRNAENLLKLGFANYSLGKVELAIQNLIQSMSIYQLYYTNNKNPVYLPINLGLWKIYEALGEYNKALDYMASVLEIAKFCYKNNINNGMSFQLSQAEIWPNLSKKANLLYWQKALKTNEEIFGENHYQSARTHYMLGQALELAHNPKTALNHYKQARKILLMLESNHPNLEQFYIKNIKNTTNKINQCAKNKEGFLKKF